MPKRSKRLKKRATKKKKPSPNAKLLTRLRRVEALFNLVAPNLPAPQAVQQSLAPDQMQCARLETELEQVHERNRYVEAKLNELRDWLVGMLTPDQIDHAKVAGCSPEVYAVEYIKINHDKFFPRVSLNK